MHNHWHGPHAEWPDYHNGFHNFALTSARSAHPGGVQVVLVDGSCHFVGENINLTLWQALGIRNGNEVISEF